MIKITSDAKGGYGLESRKPVGTMRRRFARRGPLYVLEHINPNSEAHEDWPPRVRGVGRDGKVTTLVTFAHAP